MNDERLQILRMVQEGKVSAEEASRLLEALEQPVRGTGPKPQHVRVEMVEGSKKSSFSVGVGLATWALKMLPGMVQFDLGSGAKRFDGNVLLKAIESGQTGKVFEMEEGRHRVEIWLDA